MIRLVKNKLLLYGIKQMDDKSEFLPVQTMISLSSINKSKRGGVICLYTFLSQYMIFLAIITMQLAFKTFSNLCESFFSFGTPHY